ncbi:MAG: hypothetical protein FJ304_18950 [Planctomycetes bacterium]|nr:hypothetical protein [Planctomycetota bacterium]
MSIDFTSLSGADGKLHLEIPVDQPNAEFTVEVVARQKLPVQSGWPPGYSALFRSVDDATFTTHPEPPMPAPVELE